MNTVEQFQHLPPLSVPHSFRLGVTSYVFPADIIPNVEALASQVNDIELLFLEADDIQKTVLPETITRLHRLAEQHQLTYTVHLPIDKQLGNAFEPERTKTLDGLLKIIQRSEPLAPLAFILHIGGIESKADRQRIRAWQNNVTEQLALLTKQIREPSLLCVENLDYPFEWCQGFLDDFGLSVCIDIGHLLVYGYDVDKHIKRHLECTRVIHLHAVRNGKDHLSLAKMPRKDIMHFIHLIEDYSGVLTLELYNFTNVRESIERLALCL